MDIETILKFEERDPVVKIVNEWITGNSHPMTKTPNTTGSSFSLKFYRLVSCLYIDELTGLITIKNQLLKNKDKLRQGTDDNLSSQKSRLSSCA